MELDDFFQDVADDISQKVKDITGYESDDSMEEAEEDNTKTDDILGLQFSPKDINIWFRFE